MRTLNILHLALATLAIGNTTAAATTSLPAREVHITAEGLARLPLADQQRVLELKERLEDIIATDRSALDRSQRTALRGEWKELKAEMKEFNRNGNVIYISTAGLIIIVLLLIILL